MIYVIVDTKNLNSTMLVKAANHDEIKERLILKQEEAIVGRFTDNEIEALRLANFVVISSGK